MDQRTWPTKKLTIPISPRGVTVPFRKREPPFFPRPSYRQTIANSLAIAKLSPGPRESLYTERQLLLLECGCHFAVWFWMWVCLEAGVGGCRINDGLGYVPYILYLIYFFGCYILSLYCRWNQDFMHWLCVVYLTFSRLALGTSTSLEV